MKEKLIWEDVGGRWALRFANASSVLAYLEQADGWYAYSPGLGASSVTLKATDEVGAKRETLALTVLWLRNAADGIEAEGP